MDRLRTCMITYENRSKLDYYREFSKINSEYCDRHKMDYVQSYTYQKDLPDYWIKIWMINDYLQTYDYVMWMDSDAVMRDFSFNIVDYFKQHPNAVIALSKEPPHWSFELNAGVILVKSNEKSKELFKELMELYDPTMWEKIDGKWKCTSNTCNFGGEGYEQGALSDLYKTDKWRPFFYADKWDTFCNFTCDKNSVVIHLASSYKKNYPTAVDVVKDTNNLRVDTVGPSFEEQMAIISLLVLIIGVVYFGKF